ncbi:MAG: S-methyl-5'-thioinosine phosphorylase [Thiohalospira sp.]
MADLAIIGGTGLTTLEGLAITGREVVNTPYGEVSGPVVHGELDGREVLFLPRHGPGHTIPPHRINYRANLWALNAVGAEKVIAVNAVGGIAEPMWPGRLAIPDQIIDYTRGRVNTFFDQGNGEVVHIDFTDPYCEELRQVMLRAGEAAGLDLAGEGTYAATQGPRLESRAEVEALERDGCHLVGMTGMPEAALARELELCYASCCVVANRAAGKGESVITMDEIRHYLHAGMEDVRRLLGQVAGFL